MPTERKLTPKQQRFVDEYLIDLNAGAAALRAGFSARTAGRQGQYLIHFPHIAAEIARRQAALAKEAGITVAWVLERYRRIADADLRLLYDESGELRPIREMPDELATAIAGIETESGANGVRVKKVRRWEVTKALDSLAKYLGMFVERHEHSGSIRLANELTDDQLAAIVIGADTGESSEGTPEAS